MSETTGGTGESSAHFVLVDSPPMPSMLNPNHRDAYLASDEDDAFSIDPLAKARRHHDEYVMATNSKGTSLATTVESNPPPLILDSNEGVKGQNADPFTSSPPTSYPSVFEVPPSSALSDSTPVSTTLQLQAEASDTDALPVTPVRKKSENLKIDTSANDSNNFSNFTNIPYKSFHDTSDEHTDDSAEKSAATSRANSREKECKSKSSVRSMSSSDSTLAEEEGLLSRPATPIQTSPLRSPRSLGSKKASSSPTPSFTIPPPLPLIPQSLLPMRNSPPMTGVLGRPDTLRIFRHIEWSPKNNEMCLEPGESTLSHYFPDLRLQPQPSSQRSNSDNTTGNVNKKRSRKDRSRHVDRKSFYLPVPVTVYARPDALRQIDRWNQHVSAPTEQVEEKSAHFSKSNIESEENSAGEDSSNKKQTSSQTNRGNEASESVNDMKNKGTSPNRKRKRRKRLRRRPPGYISINPKKSIGEEQRLPPLDKVSPAKQSRHVDPSKVPAFSLAFDSQFECGNLLRAQLVGASPDQSSTNSRREGPMGYCVQEYDLVLQNDLFTNGHVQW